MTAKLITLAGLLLMLSSPAFADPAQAVQAQVQAQGSTEQARSAPATPQLTRLAWQRVGAPLSLEG